MDEDGMPGAVDVLVVGGGASAVLVVEALARRCAHRDLRVLVVERERDPGRGVAYSTADDRHRMNVPVRRLSVDADDPAHLERWLGHRGHPADPEGHIPRRLYGDYLAAALEQRCRARSGLDVVVRRGTVVALDPAGHRFTVGLEGGATVDAGAVVLATGPPAGPPPVPVDPALAGDPDVLLDPWAPGALAGLAARRPGRVVVVGTGLTTVDVVLTLAAAPGVTVDAVSRNGLLPRAHPPVRASAVTPLELPEGPLTAAVLRRAVADHAAAEPEGWPATVDLVRDRAAEIWARLDEGEQAKVMGRTGALWNVHRHRMAPPIADDLARIAEDGRLRVHRGRVGAVARADGRLGVEVTGRDGPRRLPADAVVVCTGPATDVGRTTDPLVCSLLDSGLAAVGPHRWGLAVAPDGTVLDRAGQRVPGLVTVGALRRGTEAETTAIPELRDQAVALAGPLVARVGRPASCPAVRHRQPTDAEDGDGGGDGDGDGADDPAGAPVAIRR